jgi:hypothetical protein
VDESDAAKLAALVSSYAAKQVIAEPPKNVEESLLASAGATGVFDVRDAVGQRFQRDHKKGSLLHSEYNQIAGREEKRLYRESWAKRKFANMVQGKRFEKEYQTVDTSLGEYIPFGAIVIKYGGWAWAPAIRGAKQTISKCTALGGKWFMTDEFSGLHMFLVLTKGHGDIFSKKWKEFQEEYSKSVLNAVVDKPPDAGAVVGVVPPAVPPTPSKGRKGSPGGSGNGKKDLPKVKVEITESDIKEAALLKDALQLKVQMTKHKMAAAALITQVKSLSEYGWANNPANIGTLEMAITTMEGSLNDFGNDFLFQEVKTMKLKSGSLWMSELERFVKVREHLATVAAITKRIIKRSII